MIIAYVAHAISGNIEQNLADLRRIIRKINLEYPDVVPFCSYYADVVSMDDNLVNERERGIANDTELFNRKFIDELWLTGDRVSFGMEAEVKLAQHLNIPVKDYTGQL